MRFSSSMVVGAVVLVGAAACSSAPVEEQGSLGAEQRGGQPSCESLIGFTREDACRYSSVELCIAGSEPRIWAQIHAVHRILPATVPWTLHDEESGSARCEPGANIAAMIRTDRAPMCSSGEAASDEGWRMLCEVARVLDRRANAPNGKLIVHGRPYREACDDACANRKILFDQAHACANSGTIELCAPTDPRREQDIRRTLELAGVSLTARFHPGRTGQVGCRTNESLVYVRTTPQTCRSGAMTDDAWRTVLDLARFDWVKRIEGTRGP